MLSNNNNLVIRHEDIQDADKIKRKTFFFGQDSVKKNGKTNIVLVHAFQLPWSYCGTQLIANLFY